MARVASNEREIWMGPGLRPAPRRRQPGRHSVDLVALWVGVLAGVLLACGSLLVGLSTPQPPAPCGHSDVSRWCARAVVNKHWYYCATPEGGGGGEARVA